MIGLDTNVLVRFLVEDDREQTERARALLQTAIDDDVPCFVSDIVMCEVVWVLRSRYRFPKSEIITVFRRLLHARHLAFSSTDRLSRALGAYQGGRGDFADYLIREEARETGCETVMTFDGAVQKESGFTAP